MLSVIYYYSTEPVTLNTTTVLYLKHLILLKFCTSNNKYYYSNELETL